MFGKNFKWPETEAQCAIRKAEKAVQRARDKKSKTNPLATVTEDDASTSGIATNPKPKPGEIFLFKFKESTSLKL